MSKILFIGAHVDDIELSCGGTIQKHIERGDDINCVAMSYVYEGINDLSQEFTGSMECLGITKFGWKKFIVRRFSESRQEILEYFYSRKGFDIIYTHSANDLHQDHRVIGEESLRAFKSCSKLLTYTNPWNGINKKSNCFSVLTRDHLNRKIKALSFYESQKNRPYMSEESIWAIAKCSGIHCGFGFAEEFEIVKLKF